MLAFAQEHPDSLLRSCRAGHFTGSALVVHADRQRVLLMLHAKAGLWLQPGGHADGQADLGEVAWREATEETGIPLMDLVRQGEILAASNPLEGLEGASFSLKEALTGDFASIIERFNLSRSSINQWKSEGVSNFEIVKRAMAEMGLDSDLIYVNGLSTSLPPDAQRALVHAVEGLEDAVLVRPGYAVEYDYVDPTELRPTLETRRIGGLYLAGQIDGTTGYEEAAGLGLMAGINAALAVSGRPPLVLHRHEAYLAPLAGHGHGVTFKRSLATRKAQGFGNPKTTAVEKQENSAIARRHPLWHIAMAQFIIAEPRG